MLAVYLISVSQEQVTERRGVGAALVQWQKWMNFCLLKAAKSDHKAHERVALLPKSDIVKLLPVCWMCVRMLNCWIRITIHDIWWDVFISSVGVCSWQYCHARQKSWGWMGQRCRDDRKWAMRGCCLPVESQCMIPDEMIWSRVGTQLQYAFQLLGKTLRSLPWNQQSRRLNNYLIQ